MAMVINSKKCSYPVKSYNVSYLPELAKLLKERGVECYTSSYLLDIVSDIPNGLIIELAEYDCGYSTYPYMPSSDEINKMVEIINKYLP